MSTDRRRSAATATVGLTGVAGAGALRHLALEDAYGERTKKPIKRPRLAAERRFLTHTRGRAKWLAGMGLGAVSIPPAAVGVNGLINKVERKRNFLSEGIAGARDSIRDRNETFTERPPARLALGNYLAGAGVGSAAGGLTHHTLGRTKIPGHTRSAAAAMAGVVAGAATLPLQSKLTQRASHGRYEVTPTGVRRRKTKPVRPSAKAGREVAKMSPHVHGPSVRAGYFPPRTKPAKTASEVGARVGTKWTSGWTQLADAAEGYAGKHRPPPKRPVAAKATKLVRTGRNKLGETARAISYDVSSINDKDQLIRQVGTGQGRIHKADDVGANLSRRERRLRFTASGGTPFVGDFTSAAQAARLSPPELRRRTAAQQYGANVGSGMAGNVGGAVGAAALASRHKGFERRANQANDAIDGAKNRVRSAVGLGPSKPGSGRVTRALQSQKVPRLVRSSAGLVARKPAAAAVGALVGGAVTGNIGSQAAYGAIMTRDDKHRAKNPSVRHGSQKISKGDTPKPLSQREKKQLGRRKEHNAVMSMMTGTTGLSALGATLGAKGLRTKAGMRLVHPRRAIPLSRKLEKYPVPALTAGAGIGGINAYTGAAIQHKEAKQVAAVRKGFPGVRATLVTTGRRAPAVRRGFTRQTRTATGIKVSTVRGGLMR